MRILIVEDESAIAEGLKFNFEQEGYDALVAGDGIRALEFMRNEAVPVDLVVLDLMLPGMSGYEICKEIRTTNQQVPILVLSARQHSQDKAHAFDCGADQYVTKPFELHEVLSRVRNLLKRRPSEAAQELATDANFVFEFGDVRVDCRRFQVFVNGQRHSLTTMEMQLLRYFIEHEGTVLSRAQILEDVWGQSPDITTRSIDNFVMRLRKIIEPDSTRLRHLLSVRGTGYRFVAKLTSASSADDAS
jgi:two-component system OmpR family response regulator